jgi:hypothetical protein
LNRHLERMSIRATSAQHRNYDFAMGCVGSIWSTETKNGITVDLAELWVSRTYGGLLEGIPNERYNDERIQRAISAAKEPHKGWWPVHLIAPQIEYIKYPRLPEFQCIGMFDVNIPKNQDLDGSACVLVWFQKQSVVNGIELSLSELDWWKVAKDFQY